MLTPHLGPNTKPCGAVFGSWLDRGQTQREFCANLETRRSKTKTQTSVKALKKMLSDRLETVDPVLLSLVKKEAKRQTDTITLIASENFIPQSVSEVLSSCLSNKYSEGTVGNRYYKGNEVIDEIEALCRSRALKAFHLDSAKWDVNVQSLSGSPANFEVFIGLLNPHDRIMFLDLPHGGHLSHGYTTPTKKLTATGKIFETMPYSVDPSTGLIDMEHLEKLATSFRPKIIVAGISAYPRLLDYKEFRRICDKVGALLLSDIAHVAGLMAAQVIPSAFDYSDIITTTTHKTLRGPRGAMIFYRIGDTDKVDKTTGKKLPYNLKSRIDGGVFPGCQGGPHNHTIGALAVALELAAKPEFAQYQRDVLENATTLANELTKLGYAVTTGGTECHLLIVDLTRYALSTEVLSQFLEYLGIIVNKNTVPADKSALNPNGIRLGTPALTSRGCNDFKKIAVFFHRALELYLSLNSQKMLDFQEIDTNQSVSALKAEILEFTRSLTPIGEFSSLR